MATYIELKTQAEQLLKEAEAIRKAELASVISDIKAKMKEYGLTLDDLQEKTTVRIGKKPEKAPAKYYGPKGETWSGGRGRKPDWVLKIIADGGDIDQYKI